MLELPLVVVDVQRGGPSTGLPTKTEQSDLLQAMYGRNGEAPLPVVAPRSPADCFDAAIEAARIAVTHRTPVMLLSDGYLANGSEPWRLPDVRRPAAHRAGLRQPAAPRARPSCPTPATPRRWPAPGRRPAWPGSSTGSAASRRRTGTGAISYDPDNHDLMVRTRQAKVDAVQVPDVEVDDPSGAGPAAGHRLGLDVRPDRRRRTTRAPPRPRDRPGAPAPPQPVPRRTSARCCAATTASCAPR